VWATRVALHVSETGVTIIDVLVDYSRNTEPFAQLHHDVLR
jgi:hypothetical protein